MGQRTSKSDDFGWSNDDLKQYMSEDGDGLFLGTYKRADVISLFDRFLYTPKLKEKFDRDGFTFDFFLDDPFVHCLVIGHRKVYCFFFFFPFPPVCG